MANWLTEAVAKETTYNEGYENGRTAIAEELIEILETAKEDPVSDWHRGYFAAYDDVILMLKRKAGLEQ